MRLPRPRPRQNAGSLPPLNAFGGRRNLVERIANHGKIVATRLGDHQPLAFPIEPLEAESDLQRLDPVAHGSGSDTQFFRCAPRGDGDVLRRFNALLRRRGVLKGESEYYVSLAPTADDIRNAGDAGGRRSRRRVPLSAVVAVALLGRQSRRASVGSLPPYSIASNTGS